MNSIIQTAIPVIFEGSLVASAANITGNVFEETFSDNPPNKLMQTAAKVMQSVMLGFLAMWATINVSLAFLPNLPAIVHPIVGLTVMAVPILTHLAEKVFTDKKEMLESFSKQYGTALKVFNITTGIMAATIGLMVGGQLALVVLNALSVYSSAHLLRENCNKAKA